jgi:pimeloyl-ACP methyl ester carboxylesterase
MSERTVQANGIEIWTEDFGSPADPAILLVMGARGQGILWPEDLVRQLVRAGYHVIRYDNRDTGLSTCFDFAEHPYTLSDMAADAVGVLDAYGIGRAHVVGASMGGMIAQVLELEHPERLLTATIIMSSPGRGTDSAAHLPDAYPSLVEALSAPMEHPPATREEAIKQRVAIWRALAGTFAPFDEATMRERTIAEMDRARNLAAADTHGPAIEASAGRLDVLPTVTTPTLVIHGTDDPILPYEHGVAIAKAIPGAELLTIEGMGHEMPPASWPIMVPAILRHAASVSAAAVS